MRKLSASSYPDLSIKNICAFFITSIIFMGPNAESKEQGMNSSGLADCVSQFLVDIEESASQSKKIFNDQEKVEFFLSRAEGLSKRLEHKAIEVVKENKEKDECLSYFFMNVLMTDIKQQLSSLHRCASESCDASERQKYLDYLKIHTQEFLDKLGSCRDAGVQ